jgi:hypothetical protein
MELKTDKSKHSYIEIPMEGGGKIRATYNPDSWYDTAAIRISIRRTNGRLLQGPEIPIEFLGDLVKATIQLIDER